MKQSLLSSSQVLAAAVLALGFIQCSGGSTPSDSNSNSNGGSTSNGGSGGTWSPAGGSDSAGGSVSTSGGSTGSGGDATSSGGSNPSGGSGGSAVTGPGEPSAGCGKAQPAGGVQDNNTTYINDGQIEVDGLTYDYGLSVTSSYDVNTPLPLVFWWHGSGGDGRGDHEAMKWDLEQNMPAIYFWPHCTDGNWDLSADSIDVHLFDAMYEQLTNDYCVDLSRVYSAGFSMGGHFTNVLSCARGDKIRAAQPQAGGHSSDGCQGPVAWLGTHGTGDGSVTLNEGEAARDGWLDKNGCNAATAPTPYSPQPSPHTDAFAGDLQPTCVMYDCPAEYPVHWCTFEGGHDYQVWPHYVSADFWQSLVAVQ